MSGIITFSRTAVPTEEISEIFSSKTPLVIGAADSINNLGESNVSTLEGGLKLTSGVSGILGVPVGMAQLSTSLIMSTNGGEVSFAGSKVLQVNKLATLGGVALGGIGGVAGIGLYYVELTSDCKNRSYSDSKSEHVWTV
jgi:hypothetical protein